MDGVKRFRKKKNLISSNWNIISNHCGEPRARGTQVLQQQH